MHGQKTDLIIIEIATIRFLEGSSKAPYIYGTLVRYGGRVSAAVACDFDVFVLHCSQVGL